MTALLNVLEIVTERLTADGYDGLYNPDTGCACEVGHLAPCGEISGDCIAGWKVSCSCGDHDWHISSASDGEQPDPCEEER
ncbi:MAG TPA: hypothetical protein PLS95_10035 [Thermoanaerobaculales bacterium]|nr:hypothetical protein [Thermoanaerobaculales bacterium]